ncbi:MAG: 16S rRNA (adenine(1518)-N(6)/adenine(1519)-N(6))-dimethyltransferase RsmA [Candidatus Villigracilaceae bacterium]
MRLLATPPIPPLNAAAVLRRYGLHADKRLGQNFLQDRVALEKIVAPARIEKSDTVLEVGPGLGSLTRYLAAAARRVIAVELDEGLIPPLQEVLAPWQNVRIVQGDILKIAPASLLDVADYLAIANIPYYITSALIRHLLESQPRPRRLVLTVQREVAERICAAPGNLSLLALSVQVYGYPSLAAHIPAGAFYPVPKVDSAVLCVEVAPQPLIAAPLLDTFFRLIKAGFSQKRKTLRNSLSAGLGMSPSRVGELLLLAGIDPRRRAETLTLQEWQRLCERLEEGL